jgi:hypothetical protein
VGKTKRQRNKKGGIIVFLKMRSDSCSSRDCISRDEEKDIKDVVKN